MKHAIVVVGGMMSWPHRYEEMRDTISELAGLPHASIPIAPLYPFDWARLFRLEGWDKLLAKLDIFLVEHSQTSGKPLLIIGHSLGGVIGKLLLEHDTIRTRSYDSHLLIGSVVGLGSPIDSRRVDRALKFKTLLRQSDAVGDSKHYLAVHGDAVSGDPHGALAQRYAYQAYRWHIGRGNERGDLLIPEPAMIPEGVQGIRLHGVYHEKLLSTSWYGGPEIVKEWWTVVTKCLDESC